MLLRRIKQGFENPDLPNKKPNWKISIEKKSYSIPIHFPGNRFLSHSHESLRYGNHLGLLPTLDTYTID